MYNYQIRFDRAFYVLAGIMITFSACKKQDSISSENNDVSSSDFIAVAAEAASASAMIADSVYLVQPCAKGSSRDTISEETLLPSISSYIETNYPEYVFSKAYSISDASDNITEFVVVIYYNDKPVGLEFDESGVFVKTLEQREKSDLHGRGWHQGGRFGARGVPKGYYRSFCLAFHRTRIPDHESHFRYFAESLC